MGSASRSWIATALKRLAMTSELLTLICIKGRFRRL